MKLNRKPIYFLLALFLFILTACDHDKFSQVDAQTNFKLADVSGAAGGKTSYPTFSVWYDPSATDHLVICYHHRDATNMTAKPNECHLLQIPSLVPNGSIFLAINQGYGQLVESVWQEPNGDFTICTHNRDWWTSHLATATGCGTFNRPYQVNQASVLASINSGSGMAAQSFWINPDKSITVCTHDKNATGFLGLGGTAIGDVQSCTSMDIPTSLFPSEATNPRLTAVNSDASEPWETFWQDDNGYVYYCRHNGQSDGWFSNSYIGSAQWCDYWFGLKDYQITQ